MAETLDAVDFAVAAFRDDGAWVVRELAHDLEADVDALAHALQRFAGDGGAMALVGLDDDFFVILRVTIGRTRVLLSDIGAVDDWMLAESAVEFLGLPFPEDDDAPVAAGDLDLLDDLGLPGIELGLMLDDPDLYPEELLSDIAQRVGFGELFDDLVGLTSA